MAESGRWQETPTGQEKARSSWGGGQGRGAASIPGGLYISVILTPLQGRCNYPVTDQEPASRRGQITCRGSAAQEQSWDLNPGCALCSFR